MDLGSLLPLPIPERVEAVTYSEYPKWLQHKSQPPVIVNDAEQERTFAADGYFAPGCSDPEGYLLSKVTGKLDDAVRSAVAKLEQRFVTELAKLNNHVTEMVSSSLLRLHSKQMSLEEAGTTLTALQENVSEAVESSTKALAVDAMDAIRQIAKSTNSGS